MLVITRSIDQTIQIGKPGDVLTEPIIILAIDVQKRKSKKSTHMRLGVQAQRDVGVFRSEMLNAVEIRQNAKTDSVSVPTQTAKQPSRLASAYCCHLCGDERCEERACVAGVVNGPAIVPAATEPSGMTPGELQATAGL